MKKLVAFSWMLTYGSFFLQAQVEDVVTGLIYPTGFAQVGTDLFFGNTLLEGVDAELYKFSLADPDPTPILIHIGLNNPVDFLSIDNSLYVTDMLLGNIYRFDLTLPDPEAEVYADLNRPFSMAVHNETLYVSELDLNQILSIDLTDPNPVPEIFLQEAQQPKALCVLDDFLYVIFHKDTRIYRINLTDPNAVPDEVVNIGVGLFDLIVAEGEMYVSTVSGMIIKFDPLEPNPTLTLVVANLQGPEFLIRAGDNVYFTQTGIGAISKIGVVLGTEAPEFLSELVLSPNPTQGMVMINDKTTIVSVAVYNAMGQAQAVAMEENRLDLSQLAAGVYWVQVTDGSGHSETQRVVKQ